MTEWPSLALPVRPPLSPMDAKFVEQLPGGDGWQLEPKWDGFRCLAFKDGDAVALQSKAGQPLGRYFPEIVDAVRAVDARRFVIDGEIVITRPDGALDFDALLMRIHPAASRVARLARETPAQLFVFDLLVDERGRALLDRPLDERRAALERFAGSHLPQGARLKLSPATTDRRTATRWAEELRARGIDGIVAKARGAAYASGERTAMVKMKWMRTADCVVGGFRYATHGPVVGSLLLGLYDDRGLLDHVGFCATFGHEDRAALTRRLEAIEEPPGFTGRAPGGPSRWSRPGRSEDWHPLRPAIVVEVRYDHCSGDRFRHGTKFLRWRPDKTPRQCTFAQITSARGRAS